MKKQKRLILILLIVVLALGGVLAALLLTGSDEDSSEEISSELSEEDTSLITHEEGDIVAISVNNNYGSFSFYPTLVDSDDVSSDTSGTESYKYSITGYEDRDVNTSTLSTAAMAFYDLDYTKEIGEVEDESAFGFDGKITASCVYKDGSAESFEIGDTPSSGTGRYIKYNGKVYIASINTTYTNSLESLITAASWDIDYLTREKESSESDESSTESSSSTTTENYSILESLKIGGTCNSSGVEIGYDSESETYKLLSPVKAAANDDKIETLISSLLNYSANATVDLNPTDDKLKEYGLDDPYATLEITLNGESHKIVIGAETESSRYCLIDDDKTVYSILTSKISDWAECNPSEYRAENVLTDSLSDISEIKFTVDGKSSDITITREEDESSSTDSKVYYSYSSYADGEEILYSYVNELYTKFSSMTVLNINESEHEDNALVTAEIKFFDGKNKTVEIYQSSENSSRYLVYIDGEYSCTVRSTSVKDFTDEFSEYLG